MQKKTELVAAGGGKVRLSDAELHRAACKAIYEGNHIVFESLPSVIRQIIEYKTWRSFNKTSFADYALDATSNGLGVNTNQRLWMLRCAMDSKGAHIREWADVLAKVDSMVRLQAAKDGVTIHSFNGSLEMLAKNVGIETDAKITYLPSRMGGGVGGGNDGHLIRLRKNNPDIFKRVMSGELALVDACRKVGMATHYLSRGKSAVRHMTPKERREFIAWMKDEGYLV